MITMRDQVAGYSTEREFAALSDSVAALRNTVIALTILLVILSIIVLISIIQGCVNIKDQARKEERERRQRATARRMSRSKSRSKSRSRSRNKRARSNRRSRTHKRSHQDEPSKKAMIKLSLTHEEDQPKEGRGKMNEQGEDNGDKVITKDNQKMERNVKIAVAPEGEGSGEMTTPEQRAAFGKVATKWPSGNKTELSADRKASFPIGRRTNSTDGRKGSHFMAAVQDSLMIAAVPAQYDPVPNQEINKPMKPAVQENEAVHHDVGPLDSQQHGGLAAQDSLMMVGKTNQLDPVFEPGSPAAAKNGGKLGEVDVFKSEPQGSLVQLKSATSSSTDSAGFKKDSVSITMPESAPGAGKENSAKSSKGGGGPVEMADLSKCKPTVSDGSKYGVRGKVLEFVIGV